MGEPGIRLPERVRQATKNPSTPAVFDLMIGV